MLKALKLDAVMRQFILTQLTLTNYQEGQCVFVPEGATIQSLKMDDYARLVDTYAGVNDGNVQELAEKIQSLELSSTTLAPSAPAVATVEASTNTGQPPVAKPRAGDGQLLGARPAT